MPWGSACSLPRSVPFIDAMLVVLAVGATRFSVRTADLYLQHGRAGQATQRVLIMGAGEAGTMIAREMRANPQLGLDPIGFLDDDEYKHRMRIRGLPVLGNRSDLPRPGRGPQDRPGDHRHAHGAGQGHP